MGRYADNAPGTEHIDQWLEWRNHRRFPEGYHGHVHIWDIDDTYLSTGLDGSLDVVRIALEKAQDKRHLPAAPTLLRALAKHGPKGDQALAIYFVSASPRQLREVLETKLRRDGVPFDGVSLKRTWATIRRSRLVNLRAHLRRQIAYKLAALLLYRQSLPPQARITLVGDDGEQDPLIYALFADLDAGRLSAADLDRALKPTGVSEEERRALRSLVDEKPRPGGVKRILIRATGRATAMRLDPFVAVSGGLVTGVADMFGAALRMYADGQLPLTALPEIATTFISDSEGSNLDLLHSLLAAEERATVPPTIIAEAFSMLSDRGLLPASVSYHPNAADQTPPVDGVENDGFVTPAEHR